MKNKSIFVAFLLVCSTSLIHTSGGKVQKKAPSGWSLKTIFKAGLLGLVLFSGGTEAIQCVKGQLTYFPYQPELPPNTPSCHYIHCSKSSLSWYVEKTKYFCEQDSSEEHKCNVLEICSNRKECSFFEFSSLMFDGPEKVYHEERSLDHYLDDYTIEPDEYHPF